MSSDVSLGTRPIGGEADAADPTPEPRVAAVGRLLRGVGSAVLLAAASTFLIQHWQAGDDIQRYAGLLGLTAFLSLAGFFTGIRLAETKGARTFLALAAAVVPAHFCVLGGLLFSQFAWGSGPQAVAGYATWVAPSGTAALATTAAALAVLAPVVLVSMLALARSRARTLTVAFLGLNALLLLPTRDPHAVAVLLLGASASLVALELRVLRGDVALRTFEGLLVRGMLLAPPVLLALRSVLHYDVTASFAAVVCAALALLGFALSRERQLGNPVRKSLEAASLVPAAGACLFAAAALESAGLPEHAVLPLAVLPFSGLLVGLSIVAPEDRAAWRRAATVIASAATALNLAIFETTLASLACLVASIATLAYGFAAARRGLLWAGVGGAVFALAHHVQAAVHLFAWSSWGSLALVGASVIVAASLLERHHDEWARRLVSLRRRLAEREL